MTTRRQQIMEILQQNKQCAQQLANCFQTELKGIVNFSHIEDSQWSKFVESERAERVFPFI